MTNLHVSNEEDTGVEENRRLVAIMFTDIVGYSRLMSTDEAHALKLLDMHDAQVSESIGRFHGRILKRMGDAVFAEFVSATNAVLCGIDIQRRMKMHNEASGPRDRICLRIGIHLGDVIVRDQDLFGDGINVAARLEPLAQPGGICISEAVYKAIKLGSDFAPVLVGEVELKNILERHVIYQIPPFYNYVGSDPVAPPLSASSRGIVIRQVQKVPAARSSGNILFYLALSLVLGMVAGGFIGWTSDRSAVAPFEIRSAELRNPEKVAAAMLPSAAANQDLWNLFSVRGKEDLARLSPPKNEKSIEEIKAVLIGELNSVIGGTRVLGVAAHGEKIAATNRRMIEARFPDELSPLLKPRSFLEHAQERFAQSASLRWLMAGVGALCIAMGLVSYLIYRPAAVRYVVDDVRHVDDILGFLLSELGFRPPVRKSGSLVYRPEIGTFLIWGPVSFAVRIDGTSVIVVGPALFMARLGKALAAFVRRAQD